MAEDISESEFVQGNRSGAYGRSTRVGIKQSSVEEKGLMKGARSLLYKHLRGIPLTGGTVRQVSCSLLGRGVVNFSSKEKKNLCMGLLDIFKYR